MDSHFPLNVKIKLESNFSLNCTFLNSFENKLFLIAIKPQNNFVFCVLKLLPYVKSRSGYRRCSVKKVFLVFQSFFFNKVAGAACNFKRDPVRGVCSEFCEIFKKTFFFHRTPPVAAYAFRYGTKKKKVSEKKTMHNTSCQTNGVLSEQRFVHHS